jgi:hypothetical protein
LRKSHGTTSKLLYPSIKKTENLEKELNLWPLRGGDFDLCILIYFFLEKRGAKDIVKCSY